jgi:hypothetical protein
MWHGLSSYSYWMMYPFPWAFGYGDYRWRSQLPSGMMGDFPILDDWLFWVYGDLDLYQVYRTRGENEWREFYLRKKGMLPPDRNSLLKSIPRPVSGLIKKIDRAPIGAVQSDFRARSGPSLQTTEPRWITPAAPSRVAPARVVGMTAPGTGAVARQVGFRDWNPDLRLTIAYGERIDYSSARNDTVLSNHRIFARDLTPTDRSYLGHSAAGDIRSIGGWGSWGARMLPGGQNDHSSSGSQGEPRMMNSSPPPPRAKEKE